MGSKKRKGAPDASSDDVDETSKRDPSAALLEALRAAPREATLTLRRDLSLQPPAEALRNFRMVAAEAAEVLQQELDVLHKDQAGGPDEDRERMSSELAAAAVHLALGGRPQGRHRLAFKPQEVDEARTALTTLLEGGRKALLSDLRSGEGSKSFSATVKKHMGKADGRALMRLGNIRAMWLLGATPNECDVEPRETQLAQKKPRKRRRVTQNGSQSAADTQARGERPKEVEDDSSDAEPSEDKKKLSATQDFLKQLREKRAKAAKCQT